MIRRFLPLPLSALLLVASCTTVAQMTPGDGKDAHGDRVMLAAEARGAARERTETGAWADPDAITASEFRKDYPNHCVTTAGGTACTDQTPVLAGPESDPTWHGRVAIAFAQIGDGSRCFGEARQGALRGGVMSGNIVVVRSYPGAGGVIPRARTQAVVGGNGDPLHWDQVTRPAAFLDLCQRMAPIANHLDVSKP